MNNILLIIRSFVFNIYFVFWSGLISICCLPLLFSSEKILAKVCVVWAKISLIGLKLICNLEYKLVGLENLPKNEPYIVASKHQSALETMIFHLALPFPVYILKKELAFIPFYGLFLIKSGMIIINRSSKSKALRELRVKSQKPLANLRPIIIFPEGTRTMPGESISYHSGIVLLYEQNKVKVVPVALNTGIYWPKNSFIKKPGTTTIEFLPPIKPSMARNEFLSLLHLQIENTSKKLL